MTEQELKDKLLNTGYFIDNRYLDKYIQLVYHYNTDESYTEKHHILQRCYYKYNGIPVDNGKNNIVRLAYKDHCKAHWLLYFCTIDPLKQANEASVRYISGMYKKLTGKEKHKFNFIQEDFELLQRYMNNIMQDENSRYWSAEEIQFLKENYDRYGSGPYCAEKLNRPLCQINDKARLLGLCNSCPEWTVADINLVYTYYPTEGDKVYLRIPTHTKDACRAKAQELQIKTVNHYWTKDEITILVNNYPLVGASGCSKLLKNRSPNKCRHKASRLGLIYTNNQQKVWTETKLATLLQNKDSQISKLVKLLGVNYNTIKKKLIELGVYDEQIHCSHHKKGKIK